MRHFGRYVRHWIIRVSAGLTVFAAVCFPLGLAAQSIDSSTVRPSDIVGIASGLTVVAISLLADRSIERKFQTASLQRNSGVRNISDVAGTFADPGAIVFSAAAYLAGVGTHSRKVAALGMYTGEAVVLAGVIAEGVKGIAGRSRPNTDSLAVHSFHFGKGFGNDEFASFPSAETSIVFAAAAAGSSYSRRVWPHSAHIVTPAAFTIASAAGLSRLYKNEHWASDVAAGALLGTAAGFGFDRWNAMHPNNIWERLFLPKAISASHSSTSIVWNLATR